MEIFKIPYGKQNIDQEDLNAVADVLLKDFLTQGPKVKEFEDHFSAYVGSKYAIAVSNATAALHLSVMALDLKPKERVITSPITFAATANCVRYVGGEVWFADIDPDTYLLSIDSVEKLILSKPKGFFKGIIPIDFAGLPVNLEAFKILANKHDLWIIEDACHAPGGYFVDSNNDKQYCGNGNFANLSVFSFHPVKHIACGEGGMITTNSEFLYKRLMKLRTHGISKDDMIKNDGGWYYEMHELGYNYRLTDIQSALGISQLRKNPKGLERRIEIANYYKKAFRGIIKYQYLPVNDYNAHHLFVVEVDNRKKLYDYLRNNGIFAQIHYIPIHTLPYYKEIGYGDADLSNAENYYKRCISLPMYPTLKKEELDFVIKKILAFINE